MACGTPISQSELEDADYGAYPTNYQEIATAWFEESLRDPFSAQYRWEGEPQPGYHREAPITGGDVVEFGYIVYVDVNAKNGFGAYTGWEEYRLFIRDGEVKGRIKPNPYFDEPWYQD